MRLGSQQNVPFQPGYTWNENNMGTPNYSLGYGTNNSNNSNNSNPGMASGIGALLYGLFGNNHYKNPASSAMPYFQNLQNPSLFGLPFLQQIPGAISPYYQPYMNAGQGALNNLNGQYSKLLNDPTSVMNQIGSNFQSSPGYAFQKGQMENAVNNAAAAGGYVGSPQAQQKMAETVGGLANQDYWNFENKGLDLYGQGLQGEQGLAQLGYGASSNLANQLAQALAMQGHMGYEGAEDMMQAQMNLGNLAYTGQSNENQARGGQQGSLFSGIAQLLSQFL